MNHYPSTDLKFLTDFLFDGMAEVVGGGNSHFWFKQDMHIDIQITFGSPTADVMHAAHFRKSQGDIADRIAVRDRGIDQDLAGGADDLQCGLDDETDNHQRRDRVNDRRQTVFDAE